MKNSIVKKTNVQIFTIQNQLLTLKQKSLPVTLPLASKNTINKMIEAIKLKGNAAGFAASQIGVNERIIICCFSGNIDTLEIMINPTYINNGSIKEEGWEGCFSIPLTFAKVPRWKNIEVSYYTVNSDLVKKQLHGFAARIYQHECDHLEGILMTEQASELKTFPNKEEFEAFLKIVRAEREEEMKNQSCLTTKCTP